MKSLLFLFLLSSCFFGNDSKNESSLSRAVPSSKIPLENSPFEIRSMSPEGSIFAGSGVELKGHCDKGHLIEVRSKFNFIRTLPMNPSACSPDGRFKIIVEYLGDDIEKIDELSVEEFGANYQVVARSNLNVNLLCPRGYSLLHSSSGNFCVMKYEAKAGEEGLPVSKAESLPWVEITAKEAKSKCQQLGTNYDLLSNEDWMRLSQSIERNPMNWTSGKVGTGRLYQGHSDQSPLSAIDISDEENFYDQTENGIYDRPAEGLEQRRVHFIEGGEKIWDLSGNVSEWVDWEESEVFTLGPIDCPLRSHEVFYMTSLCSLQKREVVPDISSLNSLRGIGRVYGGKGGAALRGGNLKSSISSAGIYSLNLAFNERFKSKSAGFRCVYRLFDNKEF